MGRILTELYGEEALDALAKWRYESIKKRWRQVAEETGRGAETYYVVFVAFDIFCSVEAFVNWGLFYLNRFRPGCGVGGEGSPRPSTTHASKTMKVAESQNGSFNIP